MSSPNGNSNRAGPVNASTSVQNWSVNRSSVIPEHPKKQKITISIHNKLPVRQGQSQPNLHSSSLESPNKPVPSSTITNSSAMQSTSSASTASAPSKGTKQRTPTESCSKPVMNGKSKLNPSVLVPYGAESSEESDEEAKGLGRENGLATVESSHSSAQDAEDDEASRHELREPVTLNGANSTDSDPKENGLSFDGASCQVQPALHSENPFSKANGLPGKLMPAPLPPLPEDKILETFKIGNKVKGSTDETSAPGTEESPAEEEKARLEPGSPAPASPEEMDTVPSLSSKLKKALPPSDPSMKSTKEEVSENISTKPDESLLSVNHLCDANQITIRDDQLSTPCDPGNLTSDQSKAPQEMKGTLIESPQDSAAVEATGRLSLSPSSHSMGDSEQDPSVHSSRDKCTDSEDLSKSMGTSTDKPPSPQLDKVTESYSVGGPEQSPGERCEENKVGPKVHDHSPVKEKISSLRKVDRGHYRNRRERSSSGERARDSRSRTQDHYHKRRHSYTRERERAPHDRYRTEHCNGAQHHPCHSERLSPGQHRAPARYSHHHSRHRGGSDQDWSRYHHSESEHSWGREKYYPEQLRWDKFRHFHDRYAPYTAREVRDWKPFHGDRGCDKAGQYGWPFKDSYKSRRGPELLAKEKERHHFSSPRAGPPHALPPYPDKYSHEKIALVAEDSCHLADRFHDHENVKSRKRRYDSTEHGSYIEKKAWRSLQRDPIEEPKVKKHKKSKKKKKSKDKHRERDSRHQPDSDLSVAYSDADLHRHKKKKKKKKRHSRKSEDFGKDSEPHLVKAASSETVDHFRRSDGGFPLTDSLPLEGFGPFREKTKHLRMESRDNRCHLSECGQGD